LSLDAGRVCFITAGPIRPVEETSDAKNALEGYVYNMRDSLSTRLAPYEKEDVRAAFSKELDGVEVRVCCLKHCLLCTV
jgi:hypothetical protein